MTERKTLEDVYGCTFLFVLCWFFYEIGGCVGNKQGLASHFHKKSVSTNVYLDINDNDRYDGGWKSTSFEDGCCVLDPLPESEYKNKSLDEILSLQKGIARFYHGNITTGNLEEKAVSEMKEVNK